MTLHPEFRTHRLEHARTVRTRDGDGGSTKSSSALGTVEGSLQPVSAAETTVADAERAEARWNLFVEAGSGIRRDDTLTVAQVVSGGVWAAVTAGRVFRVLSVVEWRDGGTLDHDAVSLEEVQRGG